MLDKFVGLPYASMGRGPTYDCYGFCMLMSKELFGRELPDYKCDDSTDQALAAFAIFVGARDKYWSKIEVAVPGDLIFFRIGRFVSHCGIKLNEQDFAHCMMNRNSTIERIEDWEPRLAFNLRMN